MHVVRGNVKSVEPEFDLYGMRFGPVVGIAATRVEADAKWAVEVARSVLGDGDGLAAFAGMLVVAKAIRALELEVHVDAG